MATSKPILYYVLESPPCCTVLTVARILGVDLELKTVDIENKEHHKKEFVKINPFRVVPVLVDTDGFTVSESRAIASYLVQTRQPESSLYPKSDVKTRTSIDKMLQFDLGTFYRAITDVVFEIFESGQINRKKKPELEEVLKQFDVFLAINAGGLFVAGTDHITLADISLHYNYTLLELSDELDVSVYHAIQGWNRNVLKELKPYNKDGLFDDARDNLKMCAELMMQGINVFGNNLY